MWIWGVLGALAGMVAGLLGRVLLGSMRRGVRPPPLCCEITVAALWSVVAVRMACGLPWWWAPVPLLLGWLAVLLSACDVAASRLPDALTLPAYPVAAVLLAWAGYWSRAPDLATGAVVGAVVFAGTYAVVRLVSPAALGAGDVKLAGSLGAAVGAVSVPAVVLSIIAAALLTVALSVCARRRAVPHGPAMLAPSWLVVLVPGPVWAGGRC